MNDHLTDYTDGERRMFLALPKTDALDPAVEDSIVERLRDEGLIRPLRGRSFTAGYLMLAAGLLVAAWLGGVNHGVEKTRASSIEGSLLRTDLTSAERILLMQRAGSAYVAAANAYAANVGIADSVADQVSSQVLIGAAQAVARTKLDGSLSARIASMMRESGRPQAAVRPVIWY